MPDAKLAVLLAARSVSAPCLNAPMPGVCRQPAVCLSLPDILAVMTVILFWSMASG